MQDDLTKQDWVKIWFCIIIPFILGIVLAALIARVFFSTSFDNITVGRQKGAFFVFTPIVTYYYLIKKPMKWYQSQYHDSFPNFFDDEHGPSVAVRTFLSLFFGTLIVFIYLLFGFPIWIDVPVFSIVIFLVYINLKENHF